MDARGREGTLIDYDRQSPTYLVYEEGTGIVRRVRMVKFLTSKLSTKQEEPIDQSDQIRDEDLDDEVEVNQPIRGGIVDSEEPVETAAPHHARRNRHRPKWVNGYDMYFAMESEPDVEYCYT